MSTDDWAQARYDIGLCTSLEAESVGQPGSRFFRLRAHAENGSALLWLEKEELIALAHTIKRLLRRSVNPLFDSSNETPRGRSTDFDFKVVSLTLGHDHMTQRYMLMAQQSEIDGDAIVLWVDYETLNRFADQAFEIYDAGRPRCVLCGAAVSDGSRHVCPRAN